MPDRLPPILLFTDFGPAGPYLGQVRGVLWAEAPEAPVIDLIADAPAHDPMSAAYLLAAIARDCPLRAILLCVVDPGVGGARLPAIAEIDGRWYVGPDNGLFEPLLRRAGSARWWQITWRPPRLSASFHGRDLFAPIAARLARGERPEAYATGGGAPFGAPQPIDYLRRPNWPDDLGRIVYIDHFGNAMTGIRASGLDPRCVIQADGRPVGYARTFGDVPAGSPLWYENSSGLAEIAVNQGRADRALGLAIGSPVVIARPVEADGDRRSE